MDNTLLSPRKQNARVKCQDVQGSTADEPTAMRPDCREWMSVFRYPLLPVLKLHNAIPHGHFKSVSFDKATVKH